MTDERMEQIVGNLLRAGVALSAAVVLIGGIWFLASGGSPTTEFGGPSALIRVGLLILIATPVARVVFALVAFALERDYTYVTITLVVLVVLLYALGSALL